ncbi:WD40-repeat-containing domain protein [Glomus cerebriforme]|uniref:WD40-repeat-containing domain protein n=1 Tax=Glomus cerebriforme TaxID=658196 RepID=A0A397SRT4_9GLOM|nr:WD40-repeat-containing domain protein [Glomus cerebriforme]
MSSDPFFVTLKSKKRKSLTFEDVSSNGKKVKTQSGGNIPQVKEKVPPKSRIGGKNQSGKKIVDEKTDQEAVDLSSEDDIGPGGIDDMDFDKGSDEDEKSNEDENNRETPTEKKRRLAKQYIESVKEGLDEAGFDAAEIDRDLIAERLKKDALEQTGRAHRIIAESFSFPIENSSIKSGRHELTVTCVAVSENGQIFYTGSKDASIIKWDLLTGKKLRTFPGGRKEVKNFDGHTNHVLSLAISSDGKYLASGGADKKINIWSVKEDKLLKCFTQHKDSISSLAFRKGSNQLYSASFDRTIKIWNIDELCYIDTLYGHQDQIMDIDTLSRERCVSVGARDKTCRLFKVVEEKQLIFHGNKKVLKRDGQSFKEESIDVVEMIDEDNFLSGGNSGTISLWNINKKKPIFVYNLAHGTQTYESESEGIIPLAYWITSLATIKFSDLFASGSWDGNIRLWKITNNFKSFVPLTQIMMNGFVNSLRFVTAVVDEKTFLLAGIGQEHKLGRWQKIKKVKNGWRLIELPLKKE